jgi:glutathione S-transferase
MCSGQSAWFTKFHHEQIPSAKERYNQEVNRVTSVLEGWLSQQKDKYPDTNGPWLVGNKFSFADVSFVSWQQIIAMIIAKDQYNIDDYPLVKEWIEKIAARPAVKKVLDAAFAQAKAD